MEHVPVLIDEVLLSLRPKKGADVLDLTVGLGGHSSALLERIGSSGTLTAIDADTTNLSVARGRLAGNEQVTLIHGTFADLPLCLPSTERKYDCILADLGLSSPHIDDPMRGFSFRGDAPLDMRFDQASPLEDAARVLQASDPLTLMRVFSEYGELPRVRSLVDEIVAARTSEARIRRSNDLVRVVRHVYGYRADRYMPQVFQAIRMHVNRETEALQVLLQTAPFLLKGGGRLGIISYHSIEDRLVKTSFRGYATPQKDPWTGMILADAEFELTHRKPIRPTQAEMQANPRSRSAVFRVLERRKMYNECIQT